MLKTRWILAGALLVALAGAAHARGPAAGDLLLRVFYLAFSTLIGALLSREARES